jgi:hypothetical protein
VCSLTCPARRADSFRRRSRRRRTRSTSRRSTTSRATRFSSRASCSPTARRSRRRAASRTVSRLCLFVWSAALRCLYEKPALALSRRRADADADAAVSCCAPDWRRHGPNWCSATPADRRGRIGVTRQLSLSAYGKLIAGSGHSACLLRPIARLPSIARRRTAASLVLHLRPTAFERKRLHSEPNRTRPQVGDRVDRQPRRLQGLHAELRLRARRAHARPAAHWA